MLAVSKIIFASSSEASGFSLARNIFAGLCLGERASPHRASPSHASWIRQGERAEKFARPG